MFSDECFLVKMDSLRGDDSGAEVGGSFLCHRDSPGIFPAQWSLKNGLPLSPPPGDETLVTFTELLLKMCSVILF